MPNYLERKAKYPVSEVDVCSLRVDYPSHLIGNLVHTQDNGTMAVDFGEMVHNLNRAGYAFVGVGMAPYVSNGRHWALVFEEKDTFEKQWYHISDTIVECWRKEYE